MVAPASACACGGVTAPTGESVEATRPYLEDDWVIAAIKLTAGPDAPHALEGELQPIRATFSSASRPWPCGSSRARAAGRHPGDADRARRPSDVAPVVRMIG